MATTRIDRTCYPELDLIMWDRVDRFIEPEAAFYLYETRWRFVDAKRLTEHERALIESLAKEHGHGVMLTA